MLCDHTPTTHLDDTNNDLTALLQNAFLYKNKNKQIYLFIHSFLFAVCFVFVLQHQQQEEGEGVKGCVGVVCVGLVEWMDREGEMWCARQVNKVGGGGWVFTWVACFEALPSLARFA